MNTRFESKSTILSEVLKESFGEKLNLARIKFLGLFITALCSVQTVNFEKLSSAFDNKASKSSSLRRIQRFISEYALDADIIARLIFSILPNNPPYKLALDRTNWKFGGFNINILVLAIVYDGVAIPILFKMMPKFGNSSTQERIDIMDRYINLFGLSTIDCLLADREFIGDQWIGYLNENNIRYYIRIRDNFWVDDPRTGNRIKASWFFNSLRINEYRFIYRILRINGQLCYLAGSKVKNKEGSSELQLIISFNKPDQSMEIYKQRWQIEMSFRALKSSGFNIKDTHLTDMERVNKLFALVLVAFIWAYKTGVHLNEEIPIKIKKHGRKAKSLFKYGLEYIAKALFTNDLESLYRFANFLSCT